MNEKMFAFIICTNDEIYLRECIYYIEHLNVPQDFTIDIITIADAEYMTGAYNAAMRESDARYKVYLHQDVFILNRNFIADMLEIFEDKQVGMIGMVGCDKYPIDARFVSAWNVGKVFCCSALKTFLISHDTANVHDREVVAIDGMLMATQYDIEWNENLKGWHFYDASQSIEFTQKGLKIVVPYQETPWTLHDEGRSNMIDYDKYRRNFCDLYQKSGFDYNAPARLNLPIPPDNFPDVKKKIFELVDRGKFDAAAHMTYEFIKGYSEDTDLILLFIMNNIYEKEIATEGKSNVYASFNWSEVKNCYNVIKFLLRRIEYGFEISEYQEIISLVANGEISIHYLSSVIENSIYDQQRVWEELYRSYKSPDNFFQ